MTYLSEINAGDGITTKPGGWQFNVEVATTFDKHVNKSVPLYLHTQDLVSELSDWFITDNSTVVDLGCATGTTIIDLWRRHYDKNVNYIGIDNSPAMLAEAGKAISGFDKIDLHCQDALYFNYPENNLTLSLYTLQFIDPQERLKLCTRVYNSLKDRGAFLLVEKVIDSDGVTADIFCQTHWNYKKQMGYSANEIMSKSDSLRGVMIPLTLEENIKMLKDAGFKRISTFFKWCNFTGILAIK